MRRVMAAGLVMALAVLLLTLWGWPDTEPGAVALSARVTAPTAESDRAPVVPPAASVEAPAGLVAHARTTWERAAFTLAEEQGRDVVRCALGVPIGMSDLVPTGDGDDVEASGSVW
ncbi:MAG: hypothetical protein KTR31_04130 [Myxococcales bacterium]|nr:hypothetical protein [Myxococcales bacterium]